MSCAVIFDAFLKILKWSSQGQRWTLWDASPNLYAMDVNTSPLQIHAYGVMERD